MRKWRGCEGRALLQAAAVSGNVEMVPGLLDAGAQPDLERSLCLAASLGHEDEASSSVSAGAYVNFSSLASGGCDVPMRAAKCGWVRAALVNDLLGGGACPTGDNLYDALHSTSP